MDNIASLTLVGTPIGNLDDVTFRSIEILQKVSTILAEDTRVTSKLTSALKHKFTASKYCDPLVNHIFKFERFDEHASQERINELVLRAKQGEKFAFCSDAGLPTISDPGAKLVDGFYKADLSVDVVPGPTAVSSAIALSGFKAQSVYFAGFPPRKSSEQIELFEKLKHVSGVLVLYESPYRVSATLENLSSVMGEFRAALCREITKLHQEVLRDNLVQLNELIKARSIIEPLKGECVIVVEVPTNKRPSLELDTATSSNIGVKIDEMIRNGEKKGKIAKEISKIAGISRQQAYDLVVSRSKDIQ